MILADKIIENRKRNGWSQEELADKLNVSRQSVSKWEGAQAVPDMKKIVQLAELFNVSTDYLLRDDIEAYESFGETLVESGTEDTVRSVSLEEANRFLEFNERASRLISTGVMLCILSPISIFVAKIMSDMHVLPFSEDTTIACSIAVLLLVVAAAVWLFLTIGIGGKKYEYLENSRIETQYGVSGMVKERRDSYEGTYSSMLILGILLCILCAIPIFLMAMIKGNSDSMMSAAVSLLLVLLAIGVKLIVMTCIRKEGFDKLLEEGDYTRTEKKAGKYDGIYWAIVTAIYLGWSFFTLKWHMTWIVWPVGGVLFVVYHEIMKAVTNRK
ncbi:MAG: helix-turn-helix transcriptional regulator [Oscillospiraceae bacterium]|nr:helix-turn-helix transcriptional regulator [Oscillospiraceae bacterium]